MTLGPDGNLWATNGQSSIVRISGLNSPAGALDYRHGRQTHNGYPTVSETAHPTFAGVASLGSEVTLSAQKQGQNQPVSIGQVKASKSDGSWTLSSHVKFSNGSYAITATQNGDTGSPTVLYSLEPDSSGDLNALLVQIPRPKKRNSTNALHHAQTKTAVPSGHLALERATSRKATLRGSPRS
jgi:hypothetical protein